MGQAPEEQDKLRLIRAIRAADFVVSCGGGPFYSNRRSLPGLTFRQNVLHVRLAQALGKPVLFFPQSFGPFGSPAARRTVGRMLGHPRTAAIMVRESLSLEAVSRLVPASLRSKIEPCPDLAFWLSPEAEPGAIKLPALPRPWLFLTVRDWDFPEARSAAERGEMRRRYLEAVRKAACRFSLERAGSVIIIPHTRGPGDFEDDRIISRRLHVRLRADIPAERLALLDIPDKASPSDLIALYAQADLLLATRTHAAIFGLLSGRPVVSIHYQPKGLGIMASVGLADRCLPIAGVDPERLGRTLDVAAEQTGGEAGRIAERIAALRSEIAARIGRALAAAEGRP
jgi:colanic acid/amylovoran biosynthesis protein